MNKKKVQKLQPIIFHQNNLMLDYFNTPIAPDGQKESPNAPPLHKRIERGEVPEDPGLSYKQKSILSGHMVFLGCLKTIR